MGRLFILVQVKTANRAGYMRKLLSLSIIKNTSLYLVGCMGRDLLQVRQTSINYYWLRFSVKPFGRRKSKKREITRDMSVEQYFSRQR